jgi:hypothetical protein
MWGATDNVAARVSLRVQSSLQGTEQWRDEVRVLAALESRNRDQHRRTGYFRQLQAVSRSVRLSASLQPAALCRDLAAVMDKGVPAGIPAGPLPRCPSERKKIASAQLLTLRCWACAQYECCGLVWTLRAACSAHCAARDTGAVGLVFYQHISAHSSKQSPTLFPT